jgi:ribonuclease VapC
VKPLLAVDSSALIAIVNGEPEAATFENALVDGSPNIGWPTIFETRIWLLRRGGGQAGRWFEAWLDRPSTTAVPFDGELERLAARASERFGNGRHPAGLNFGDCMAYAVARHHDAPLLFKGSDFARTDITVHEASVVTA